MIIEKKVEIEGGGSIPQYLTVAITLGRGTVVVYAR